MTAALRWTLLAIIFSVALWTTTSVAAEPRYQVSASVTHLGEEVAAPSFVAVEGETVRVFDGDPPNYTMAMLIRPSLEGEVSVSMDYVSGNISIQPNLQVPLGEAYQVVEDKVVLTLRIDRMTD